MHRCICAPCCCAHPIGTGDSACLAEREGMRWWEGAKVWIASVYGERVCLHPCMVFLGLSYGRPRPAAALLLSLAFAALALLCCSRVTLLCSCGAPVSSSSGYALLH